MLDPREPALRLPDVDVASLRANIDAALADRALLQDATGLYARSVREVVWRLDQGQLRVAERNPNASDPESADRWTVNAWIQQAVGLFFPLSKLETVRAGDLEYTDKLPPKHDLFATGVRVVPPAVVRYGAFVEKGAVVMPGLVNIGAHVGAGTMVDTWATVGSCAQVGKGVHLSGGVGLGGVLEPPGARPVIIEDGAFIGSRCVVVEGVLVEEEAVLGAGVVLTGSTQILDVSGDTEKVLKGRIPARSVVLPGVRPRKFPAGEYLVPCALIVGQRKASTDQKTSLNTALRDFGVSV
ncbi:MAG: 2,3,4,5-tetrahydropyridine-2,6-dicarboxylate N-succinyltransferase [Deltaproteobacteria bacterium]|nr:2,3,4,5-tetrahydropyridine-2,6-dicarboxylate N-succinyltransferase [Deltaproteobacteria bacterium]